MTRPFEELYGEKCNTSISWSDLMNNVDIVPYMIKEMKHELTTIRKNLEIDQDRKKSYGDPHRVHKEFNMGDYVYFYIIPKEISFRNASCDQLALWFCGPFQILEGPR